MWSIILNASEPNTATMITGIIAGVTAGIVAIIEAVDKLVEKYVKSKNCCAKKKHGKPKR